MNEQNQIHDRLLNDQYNTYLSDFLTLFNVRWLVNRATDFGLTKLFFPVAKAVYISISDYLLVYTVGRFGSINNRIQTGRDTLVGCFANRTRRDLIAGWAHHQWHYGTRMDYNTINYCLDKRAIIPGGEIYSPPIGYYLNPHYRPTYVDRTTPVWPYYPGKKWPFLHAEPLKVRLRSFNEWISQGQIAAWLSPLSAPQQDLDVCQLDELCEIIEGISPI